MSVHWGQRVWEAPHGEDCAGRFAREHGHALRRCRNEGDVDDARRCCGEKTQVIDV